MAITIKHAKTDTIADWTQTDLDAQIALGNFPPGTVLADIVLPSDWNNDHTISGTVPIANGGTGQTTATAAINALLPSQSSQSGKVLSTDGTNTSWIAAGGTGTVTSVTGTAPVSVATGTTTPVISMAAANTTTNGYLTSTDWNTFNGKAPATSGTSILYGNGSGGFSNVTVGSGLSFSTGTLSATGGSMVYPGAGIPNSTGTAWGTSYTTTGTGTVVALQTAASLNNPTISNYADWGNGSATTLAAGRMWYNGSTGSWNLGMGNGNITQQVGEELFVYGKASAAITDSPLQIVYHTGTVGSSGVVTFAPTIAGITDENAIIGVATENIALNGFGRVTAFGVIHGITTNGTAFGETWADDDVIWYNPVTGNPTKVKPSAPNIKFQIGTVISAGSGGSGSFHVALVQGTQFGGTDSNVKLTSPTNGQILTYDTSNTYWKNTSLTAGTGISISAATGGVLTVSNSGVTSVTGTSPVISSGGATPAISMAAASTSVDGYLTSTDWNTFNNKGSGTVTSVSATSPVTSTGGATPTIAMPAATTSVSGYLTSTDWTTFNNKGSGTVTSVAALTLGTTGTDLSSTVATGTTTPVITLNVPTASATNRGVLSSADWTTFNNKGSGTVTSVSGTGTVAGISLSGTVTSTGNLTLGGTFALPSGQVTGKMIYDTFTATASQTSFTTSQTYTSGKIQVAVNGVILLNGTDCTVTSGTAVVMATGLTVGDIVTITYPI
jgi:hypothetical protein